MEHHFNIDLAAKYGIEEAIMIDCMFFWIKKNEANEQYFRDGRYWTSNTVKSYSEYFPYMNAEKISRTINNLIKQDIFIKDKAEKSSLNRTNWYSFTDNGLAIIKEFGYHFSKTEMNTANNSEIIQIKKSIGPIVNNNKQIEDKPFELESETIPKESAKSASQLIENTIDEQSNELYALYPARCPLRDKSLGKKFKDKEKIKKLIEKFGYEQLRYIFESEIKEKFGKSYMSNFSTFLNNIPDYGYDGIIEKETSAVKTELFPSIEDLDFEKIKRMFNDTCKSYPRVEFLTDSRRQKIRMRFVEMGYDYDLLQSIFDKMEESEYLQGKNRYDWKAGFDWLFDNDINWTRIAEDNYKEIGKNTSTQDINAIWE